VLIGSIGLAIVGLLLYSGSKINAAEAQLKAERGSATDDAVIGYNRLVAVGLSPGVAKPFIVLVENNRSPATLSAIVSRLDHTSGLAGAAAPSDWRNDGTALVETFPALDSASDAAGKTASRLKHDVLPALERQAGGETQLTLAGTAPEDRDFSHAVYSKFPYALAFVILLTFVLLMRAFRSVFLAFKAVVLNLISLVAAYGIIVFVFQEGHGAQAIWHIQATDAIISWIPLMIFAFLYGLSMDYEVFMLTRMREEYDEHHDTDKAIALGLARTGKLITSAALVLMFAFFVLSTSPGPDIKQFGIGLAAGIIFDATVIRALLVPSIMKVAGDWNWWFPEPVRKVLFVRAEPALETD
jgi:RND superfamily putative drug exporter